MSQDNRDEMPDEIDFTGAVRGKYYARFHGAASFTTADGPITLSALSTGDPTAMKLVIRMSDIHVSLRNPRIAPEALTPSA